METVANQFEFKVGTLEDVDAAAQLFDEYRQFYKQVSDVELAKKFLKERIQKRESVILLAVHKKGEVREYAGFLQFYPSFGSISLEPLWILNDLFVREGFRRLHIGRELMKFAQQHASAAGVGSLQLQTHRNNRSAQSLYRSLGWTEEQEFLTFNMEL